MEWLKPDVVLGSLLYAVMGVLIFWISWVTGDWVALTLFGLVSFFSLREFMTQARCNTTLAS